MTRGRQRAVVIRRCATIGVLAVLLTWSAGIVLSRVRLGSVPQGWLRWSYINPPAGQGCITRVIAHVDHSWAILSYESNPLGPFPPEYRSRYSISTFWETFDSGLRATMPAGLVPSMNRYSPEHVGYGSFCVVASGWPELALRGVRVERRTQFNDPRVDVATTEEGLTSKLWHHPSFQGDPLKSPAFWPPPSESPIPWRPVWPGFVINWMVYMTPLFVLYAFFGSIRLARDSRRHRKGQCVKCAYSRDGLSKSSLPCPECGTPGGWTVWCGSPVASDSVESDSR